MKRKHIGLCIAIIGVLMGSGCCGGPKAPTPEIIIIVEAQPGAKVAKAGDEVTVHYTGWLDDKGKPGTKFDSSVDRDMPFSFKLGAGRVIQGWDLGVAGMKVGEKRRLIIPASLGYGSRGAGRLIPPNATLIFDVELISIG